MKIDKPSTALRSQVRQLRAPASPANNSAAAEAGLPLVVERAKQFLDENESTAANTAEEREKRLGEMRELVQRFGLTLSFDNLRSAQLPPAWAYLLATVASKTTDLLDENWGGQKQQTGLFQTEPADIYRIWEKSAAKNPPEELQLKWLLKPPKKKEGDGVNDEHGRAAGSSSSMLKESSSKPNASASSSKPTASPSQPNASASSSKPNASASSSKPKTREYQAAFHNARKHTQRCLLLGDPPERLKFRGEDNEVG